LPLRDNHAKEDLTSRWPVDKYEVIHPANASGIDIAQCHNGILDTKQCDWAILPLRCRGETYGEAQGGSLREIMLAAFEGVLLLSWGLGGLPPVYEA